MKAATAQAARPDTMEDWCILVPHLLSQEGWQTLAQKPSSALLQCSSPWGDTLIKCLLHDVVVLNPPEDPAYTFVRPETRAWSCECHPDPAQVEEVRKVTQLLAPGTCAETFLADWPWIRLCDTLFGILHPQHVLGTMCFGHSALPKTTVERVRRNFPEKGDCALTWRDQNDSSDDLACMLLCRLQENGNYTVQFVMGTSYLLQMPNWAADAIRLLLDAMRCEAIRAFNRPQLALERERDRRLYMVLSITSFGTRLPMIPSLGQGVETGQPFTQIKSGQGLGLSTWVAYEPGLFVGSGKSFRLSDYLCLFFQRARVHLRAYQSLDGQELLPYQCVVQREEWYAARDRFKAVFALQKAAYRRANGGTAVPRIVEETTPRLCREVVQSSRRKPRLQSNRGEPDLVQKAFIEIPEGMSFGKGFADGRRCRTLSPVR